MQFNDTLCINKKNYLQIYDVSFRSDFFFLNFGYYVHYLSHYEGMIFI